MDRRDYARGRVCEDFMRCIDPEDDDADTKRRIEASTPILCHRLYFAVLSSCDPLKSRNARTRFFSIDDKLVYQNFYNDFGPLNIAMVYQYCTMLNEMLQDSSLDSSRIVHYTKPETSKILNAAFLIGSYAIIYLHYTVKSVMQTLKPALNRVNGMKFCDASQHDLYYLSLTDCLSAMAKAHHKAFFKFSDFDVHQYQHYERVENGDLNWIVPGKFLAFCGPQSESRFENGISVHGPSAYIDYFKRHNVTAVIRLNLKKYEARSFTDAGINHYDLFFNDGGTPSDYILRRFLEICEEENGAIAVHCKAGLGRTGTLIGAYLIKHFDFNAMEAIAWLRICRPGSVIGQQQQWLQGKEQWLSAAGNAFRRRNVQFDYSYGIYSLALERSAETNASGRQDDQVLTTKVHSMRLDEENYEEAAKKANLINNNSLPNTDRPSPIASRLRSKSLSVESRIASHRPQSVRQKPKARGTSLPVRNDKAETGPSRRRKSTSIVVEQSPGSTQGESLNKIKAMRSKCMATLPETTLENANADDASHPPTKLALQIPLQSTPAKETILASNITQPTPLLSSDSIMQALKSSPSPETIPEELLSPTNLASKLPVQTTSMEVKVRPPDAAPQASAPSANSPVALKRSSSLETLPWNDNDESAGHADTPNESFSEDSIDDTVDMLIPVVDVRYLGKKSTVRPGVMMKLAELSPSKRPVTKSRENVMPAQDKVKARMTRNRKSLDVVAEQRPGISDVLSNKVTRQRRMSTIPEKSLENANAEDASHPPTKLALQIPLQSTPAKETILASNITQPTPLLSSDSIMQALKSSPSPETIPEELLSPTNLASKLPVQTTSMEVKVRPPDAAPQASAPSANSPVALKRSSSLETLPWNDNDESAGHADTPNESFSEDSIDDTVDMLIPVVDVRYLGKKSTERPRIMIKLAELSPSKCENAMPARNKTGEGMPLRSLVVLIETCPEITNILANNATHPIRLSTIPENSCPATTTESIVEIKQEVEDEMPYEVSFDSIPTLNESFAMESLRWIEEDNNEYYDLPIIAAVHGAEELKILLAGITDGDDVDSFAPQDESANIADPQCSHSFRQMESVAGITDGDDADSFAPQDEIANIVDPQCSQSFRQAEALAEQELQQPPPAKPPKIPAPKRSRSLSQEIVRGKGASTLRTGSDQAARMVNDSNVVEGEDGPRSGHLTRRRLRLRSERQRHDYTHHHLRSCR